MIEVVVLGDGMRLLGLGRPLDHGTHTGRIAAPLHKPHAEHSAKRREGAAEVELFPR
jgi:hypothetical protein